LPDLGFGELDLDPHTLPRFVHFGLVSVVDLGHVDREQVGENVGKPSFDQAVERFDVVADDVGVLKSPQNEGIHVWCSEVIVEDCFDIGVFFLGYQNFFPRLGWGWFR